MAINLWVLSRASSEFSSWFRFPKSLYAVVWGKKVIDFSRTHSVPQVREQGAESSSAPNLSPTGW